MLYSLFCFLLLFHCIPRNVLHFCCFNSENRKMAACNMLCVCHQWKNMKEFNPQRQEGFLCLVVTNPVCSLAFVSLLWPLLFHFFMYPLPPFSLCDCLGAIWVALHCRVLKLMYPYGFICSLHTCKHVDAKDVKVMCSRHNTIFGLPWFNPPTPKSACEIWWEVWISVYQTSLLHSYKFRSSGEYPVRDMSV
jgi:hypothetical protein